MTKYTAPFILCTALLTTTANADSLRCNGQLASAGDTKADIIELCGEPLMTDSYCEPSAAITTPQGVQNGNNNIQNNVAIQTCTEVEIWTYNPGKGKFMTHLYFTQGELRNIRYGNRVK